MNWALRTAATALLAGVAVATPREARADVTSWFAVGGGFGFQGSEVAATGTQKGGIFNASLGVGSSSRAPVVIGGIVRSMTLLGAGTDVSLSTRVASGGFARGEWGLAVDLGVAARPWGNGDHGRWPLQGILTLGAPFGLNLGVGGHLLDVGGYRPAQGGFAILELDLLRLTVMRQGGSESFWPNPSPAGGHRPPGAP